MKCDRCKGKRKVKIFDSKHYLLEEKCYKCHGTGETDWLSKIFEEDQTKFNKEFIDDAYYTFGDGLIMLMKKD
jgi:hypothetical protein